MVGGSESDGLVAAAANASESDGLALAPAMGVAEAIAILHNR